MVSSMFIKLLSTGKEVTWGVLKTFIVQSSFLLEKHKFGDSSQRGLLVPTGRSHVCWLGQCPGARDLADWAAPRMGTISEK